MATEEELSCFLRQQVWLEEAHKYIVDSEVQRQTTPPSARELEVGGHQLLMRVLRDMYLCTSQGQP